MNLGTSVDGKKFSLNITDVVTERFALVGRSGSGKTVGSAVMAEELCLALQPWIAFDVVGNWRGLKAGRDGKSKGFSVVVIGGEWRDLELDPKQGARYAAAVCGKNVFAVFDLARTADEERYVFVRDFFRELIRQRPQVHRHVFFEELSRLANQNAKGKASDCKAACDVFATEGRNYGFGYTMVTQRPQIASKTVLNQCGSLFVMQLTGTRDLKEVLDWTTTNGPEIDKKKFVREVARLDKGEAFYINPQAREPMVRMRFRQRQTLHPAEMIKTDPALLKRAVMADSTSFTEEFKSELSRVVVAAPAAPVVRRSKTERNAINDQLMTEAADKMDELYAERKELQEENLLLKKQLQAALGCLERVKEATRAQFEALKLLHVEQPDQIETTAAEEDGAVVSGDKYRIWIDQSPEGGIRQCVEMAVRVRRFNYARLKTLAHVGQSTAYQAVHWMKKAGLIVKDGQEFVVSDK